MKFKFSKPGSFFTVDGHRFVAQEPDSQSDHQRQRWIAETCSEVVTEWQTHFRDAPETHWSHSSTSNQYKRRDEAARLAVKRHNLNLAKAVELIARYAPDRLAGGNKEVAA